MACDICGVKGKALVPLLDFYQTDEIKDICSECENVVNRQQRKLHSVTREMVSTWLKRFMKERAASFSRRKNK